MPRHPVCVALVLLFASHFAAADVVTLKDGRVFEGKILEDDGKVLKIKLRKGTMSLNRADVDSIVQKPTPEDEYQARLAKLDAGSAAAQLEIGRWAGERELNEEAIRHFLAAYALDAKLSGVADELSKRDYHLVKGTWQDPDTYYPTVGYVKFDGHWCSPDELAYRKALKDVTPLTNARDAVKTSIQEIAGKVKKLDARIAAERATVAAVTKLIDKAKADQAAAQERFTAADAKVKIASDKLAAVQSKEKVKEGDPTKPQSQAVKDAEKKLVDARAAAEKEGKSVAALQKIIGDQTTEKGAAEARILDLEKEKTEAGKGSAAAEEDLKTAQAAVDAAMVKVGELKAAWEKTK